MMQDSRYRIQDKSIVHRASCIMHRGRGFTLIETIMVMVIIAILAVVVVIRNPFDSIKLSSAAKKVAADIRYAQKLAISTQQRCGIFFISGNSYRIFENNNTADPATSSGDTCSDNGGNFEVDFSAGRCSNYSGVAFSATPTIYFNSLGKPVDGTGNDLATQIVTLTLSSISQSITIEAGTGRVSF
ncbi:MAG: GspH/FimT family pseudopilin [Nitrospirae bacterium]|nr:GspH/FimT family pseudopilin [Nitrospirota bacterium]